MELLCISYRVVTNMHTLKSGSLMVFDSSVCNTSTVCRALNLEGY